MYQIKQIPEDFIVKERSTIIPTPHGRYLYVLLRKTNRNTLDVVKELSRILRIKDKQIGFAGSKDKHGITEQVLSLPQSAKNVISSVNIENASFTILGSGEEPLHLGDLTGNSFEIVVRNLDPGIIAESLERPSFTENYFDEQRFSSHNVVIGKALLKKDFAEAARLLEHASCLYHLEQHPRDYIGALKTLPIRLLRMYVNAFQSSLWNRTVAAYLQKEAHIKKRVESTQGELVFVDHPEKWRDLQIPLIGFGEVLSDNVLIAAIIERLLQQEGITPRDFIIKQIPELTIEGEPRHIVVPVIDLHLGTPQDDELNPGQKKLAMMFTLPKGSYATMLMKRIFS